MAALATGIVFLICVLADRLSFKIGLPALVLFMLVGMIFGSDGPFHIGFDNYQLCKEICSYALLFIMFYGGFNLKWKSAKPIALHAVVLSTGGVLITTIISMGLLMLLFHTGWKEALLISAVLGSTDAASVFSILRRKHLNLKYDTAPLLEMESGSNDPISWMLTAIAVELYKTGAVSNIFTTLVLQIGVGLLAGFLFAKAALWLFNRTRLISSEFSSLALAAMVTACYGLSSVLSGNAYLSVYLMGVMAGNAHLPDKKNLIAFFDGLTTTAQVMIFFLLGLLSFPSQIPQVLPLAAGTFLILLLAARPAAVFITGLFFHSPIRQSLLVSFAGLRGAASCVFAVMAVASGVWLEQNLFQIVFVVTLLSVSIQGSLLPFVSKKLQMIDDQQDVRKTFNDYVEEESLSLIRLKMEPDGPWVNKTIGEIQFQPHTLALMIERGSENVICKGQTRILPGDILVLGSIPFHSSGNENLQEIILNENHPWSGRTVASLSLANDELIALIVRNEGSIIPGGGTILQPNDRLLLLHSQQQTG